MEKPKWLKEYDVNVRYVPQHYDRNQGRVIAAHFRLECVDHRGLRYVATGRSFREARAHLAKNMLSKAQELKQKDVVFFRFRKEWEKGG